MYQDLKFSRFMFHLKFSKTDDFVHEHELYEVMRSRNLYQTQFGLRSNFQKLMRNIAKDEKQRKYNFENSRKIFVQKMKERREQVDKLRSNMNKKLQSLSKMDDEAEKNQRQYVPIPRSTVVYTELPPIVPFEPELPLVEPSPRSFDTEKLTLPHTAPTPSMVATTYNTEHPSKQEDATDKEQQCVLRNNFLSAKVMIAGKTAPRTLTAKTNRTYHSHGDNSVEEQLVNNEELVDELRSLKIDCKLKKTESRDNERENIENFDHGHDNAYASTLFSVEQSKQENNTNNQENPLLNASETQEWAVKHALVKSKDDILKGQDFQRLFIDRPSKWALNHVRVETAEEQSKILDMKLRDSRRIFNQSFRRKSRKLDALSMKLNIHQRISLPELDTSPKPMVTLDPGGTTPDGRLILTKADYEEYLSSYRKARNVRLERSKKRSKLLKKQIDNFAIDPQLCLRDETRLRVSQQTI